MPNPSLARLCIAAAFSLIAAACEESGESRGGKLAKYASYKDVPGMEFYEWGDLIAGLESGKVDFTGEMTASEERRNEIKSSLKRKDFGIA